MTEKNLFTSLNNTEVLNAVRERPEFPETVTSFLGRLFLLHGVPFHYLLPDEKLLEPESLKFFYVDREWIAALIDGTLSIGLDEDTAGYLNKAMVVMSANYIKEAREIRTQARPETDIPITVTAPPDSQGFTGFLLRSRLLAGWPGIQIRAFKGEKQLPILRLDRVDRVDPVVLFGLVDGELDKLDITQPPEGLHFQMPKDTNTTIWRNLKSDGVLDVLKLRQSLTLSGGPAEFASKMIAEPLRGVFTFEA
jgi:hypothetical protein